MTRIKSLLQVCIFTGLLSLWVGSQPALAQGTVSGWGYNLYSQLGNGSNANASTPVAVSGLTGVVAVSGGVRHSLGLKDDGTVWAWGSSDFGQLGNGTYTASTTPVQVNGLSGVVGISAGWLHSLALKSDGTVWAWGRNAEGQLGNGANDGSASPVQVSGLTGVRAIAGGAYHSLALKTDGTVQTWGQNTYGQLGTGNNVDRNTPLAIAGLTGVMSVAGGEGHSLALKQDGTVRAWGWNGNGQLGVGTNTNSNTPVTVSSLAGVVAVASGATQGFAVNADGTASAWGQNNEGQLGIGTHTDSNVPVAVVGLAGVKAIASGSWQGYALKNDGTVWAWGYNAEGELGNGTTGPDHPTPAPVNGLKDVLAIASGTYFGLALQKPAAPGLSAQVFAYVANAGLNSISAYAVDATTGGLTNIPGSPFTAGLKPYSVTVHPTGKFAYVANRDSNNVSVYAIDQATGVLSQITGSPFAAGTNPKSVTVDPSGKFAYVANHLSDVSAYTISLLTGALTPVTGSPFIAGTNPVSVVVEPTGRFAYVANFTSNNITEFQINPSTGALTSFSNLPSPVSVGNLTMHPTGKFIYAGLPTTNKLSAFSLDPSGILTSVPGSPFTTGVGPWTVAVHPSGRFAYSANDDEGTVSGFTIDQTSGVLSTIPGPPVIAGTRPFFVAVDPTGKFAYATNTDSNDISGYSINPASGALSPIGTFALANSYPLSIALVKINPSIPVTIASSPAGEAFSVSGTGCQAGSYTSPQTLAWVSGAACTVNFSSPQSGTPGTQYVFNSWADGAGALNPRTMVAPGAATTYTANFTTQYLLTTAANPVTAGAVLGGGWYNSGTTATVQATSQICCGLSSWTGAASSGTNTATVLMDGPKSVTGNFLPVTAVTVKTSPAGLYFTIDNVNYNSSQVFLWLVGSTHTIATTSQTGSPSGTKNDFTNWSDGGLIAHTVVTPGAPITYTANFQTGYLLTTLASPAAGGTILPGTGFFNAGSSKSVSATANPGYVFAGFSGGLSGTASPQNLILNAPTTVTANFWTKPDLTVTKTHSGSFRQGDQGGTYTITVKNVGQTTTTGSILVSDALPGGLTLTGYIWPSGWSCYTVPLQCSTSSSMPAGASAVWTIFVKVAANAPPSITNTATVSGGGDANPNNNSASDATPIVQVADLTISSTHSGTFAQGDTADQYTLTVTNVGQGPTLGVVKVIDAVGLTAKSLSGAGWSCTLSNLTCTRTDALDTLGAGKSFPPIALIVSIPGNAAPFAVNNATVSGGGELNLFNNGTVDPTTIRQHVPVTVTASPAGAGLKVMVDGTTVTAPQTFFWLQGDTHTLSASSPQPSPNPFLHGTYHWSNWSDYGQPTHMITVPASGAVYTAYFK